MQKLNNSMAPFLSPQSILGVRLSYCPPSNMIREWHDQPSASALESARLESACLLLYIPAEGKNQGSVWQRHRTQTRAESLHMSAQRLQILLAWRGWRWGGHRGEEWCFVCIMNQSEESCVFLSSCFAKICISSTLSSGDMGEKAQNRHFVPT